MEEGAASASTAQAIKAKLKKSGKFKNLFRNDESKSVRAEKKNNKEQYVDCKSETKTEEVSKTYNKNEFINKVEMKEKDVNESIVTDNVNEKITYIDDEIASKTEEKTVENISPEHKDPISTNDNIPESLSSLSDHRDSVMFQEIYSDQWWDASNLVIERIISTKTDAIITNVSNRLQTVCDAQKVDITDNSKVDDDDESCCVSKFYDATEFHGSSTPPSNDWKELELCNGYEEIQVESVPQQPSNPDLNIGTAGSPPSSSVKAREWVKSFNEIANEEADQIVALHAEDLRKISKCYSETELRESIGAWAHKDEIILNDGVFNQHSNDVNFHPNCVSADEKWCSSADMQERAKLARTESLKKVFEVKSKMGIGPIVDTSSDALRRTDLYLAFTPAVLASISNGRSLVAIDSLDEDLMVAPPEKPVKISQRETIPLVKIIQPVKIIEPENTHTSVEIPKDHNPTHNDYNSTVVSNEKKSSGANMDIVDETSEFNRILDVIEGRSEMNHNIFGAENLTSEITDTEIDANKTNSNKFLGDAEINNGGETDEIESISQWNASFVEDDQSRGEVSSEEVDANQDDERKVKKISGASKISKSIKSFAGALFTDHSKPKTEVVNQRTEIQCKDDKKKFKFNVKEKIVKKFVSGSNKTDIQLKEDLKNDSSFIQPPKIVITASSFDHSAGETNKKDIIDIGDTISNKSSTEPPLSEYNTDERDDSTLNLNLSEASLDLAIASSKTTENDKHLPDFSKISQSDDNNRCMINEDASTYCVFESIQDTEDDECKFSEDDKLDDENATMYFSFRTAGERSKSNSFSADEEDITLLKKVGIIKSAEEEETMRQFAVIDSKSSKDYDPRKELQMSVHNKVQEQSQKLQEIGIEIESMNCFEELLVQNETVNVSSHEPNLSVSQFEMPDEKFKDESINIDKFPGLPKPNPRSKKNKSCYQNKAEILEQSSNCAESKTNVEKNMVKHIQQGKTSDNSKVTNRVDLLSHINETSVTDKTHEKYYQLNGHGDALYDPDTGEHIYCEIGDTNSAIAPKAKPRGKKGKKDPPLIVEIEFEAAKQPHAQLNSDVSNYFDQSSQNSIPDWLKSRGPIPNPRKQKQVSMQCIPNTLQDLGFSNDIAITNPTSRSSGLPLKSTPITLKASEPKAWEGEEFYCGKAASIAYGISSHSGDPIIGVKEEFLHSAPPPQLDKLSNKKNTGTEIGNKSSVAARPTSLVDVSGSTKNQIDPTNITQAAEKNKCCGNPFMENNSNIYGTEQRPARRRKKTNPGTQDDVESVSQLSLKNKVNLNS